MNNVSLIKVTSFVCVLATASFLVSAENNKVVFEAPTAASQNVTEVASFSELISRLDNNKDGMLNQSEVSVSNNSFLKNTFAKIDQDNNLAISETEFNNYTANIK
jgi:hypothetical protein